MKTKRNILAVLLLTGIALTLELGYIFFKVNFNLSANPSFCSVNNLIDCDGVARTSYAMFFGVPLAFWGLFLYIIMMFLIFTPYIKEKFPNSIFKVFKNPYSYIATLGLISFCISMLLAFVSIFEIQKICALCFVTYFLDLIIAFTAKTSGSFFKVDIKNTIQDFIAGAKEYFILFTTVVIAAVGILIYTSTSYVFSPNMKAQKSFDTFKKMKKNPYKITGNVLGNKSGKIKIYVYSDFLCPFCKIVNTMVHKLVKENNDIYVVHMNYPLDTSCNSYLTRSIHPGACEVARYALAAKNQKKYWDMTNAIYDNAPRDKNELLELAKTIGLNTEQLEKDANSEDIMQELGIQINYAGANNINATPSFTIDDIDYIGAMPYFELTEKINQARKRHSRENNE